MKAQQQPIPGIVVGQCGQSLWDSYRGSGDSLVAAGLVTPEQLPGRPGSAKMMMSFLPDGTRIRQGSTAAGWLAGCKRITKLRNGEFVVTISVDEKEYRRRLELRWQKYEQEDSRATPASPAPARGHLRLVWSAPAQ